MSLNPLTAEGATMVQLSEMNAKRKGVVIPGTKTIYSQRGLEFVQFISRLELIVYVTVNYVCALQNDLVQLGQESRELACFGTEGQMESVD